MRHKTNLTFKKKLSPWHTFYKSNVKSPLNFTSICFIIISGVLKYMDHTSLRTVFLLYSQKGGNLTFLF